jgi:hypothetical protein
MPDHEEIPVLHPACRRLYQLLIEHRSAGCTAPWLLAALYNEGLTAGRQAVHAWLNRAEQHGYVLRARRREGKDRWIWQFPEGQEFSIPGFGGTGYTTAKDVHKTGDQETAVAAGIFRVTRIDLDENQDVSAVHAVTDQATLEVIRQLAAGSFDITGHAGTGLRHPGSWAIRLPSRTFLEVLYHSGKICGGDPLYRPGLNSSLFRIWAGLIEGRP